MTTFRVYMNDPGGKISTVIDADTPEEAGKSARKNNPGAIVTKIKVVTSHLQPVRGV